MPSPDNRQAVRTPPPSAGQFGKFEVIERIASGGMGVVYKARQSDLNRIVALKVLPFGPFTREEFVRRFQLEAGATARLRHPNIVAIFEVGTVEGCPFFSMEFVDGPTLADLVRNQPLPVSRAVRFVRTIAEAVHYAHEQGILHRDLKPANVLIDALDQPRITDFGLARDLHHRSDLTLSGQAVGSPSFMPPEQAEGRHGDVGPRSDIYGLGGILYFLLSGRPPFAADSTAAVLQQVVCNDPVPLRMMNPGLPRDLETICLKCLEKDPERRYATARDVAEELARYQRDEPIHARPAHASERAWRWCRRRPAIAGLMAMLAFVIAAGFSTSFWQWRRAEQNASRLSDSVTRLEIERAEDRLARGDTADGLALLAQVLRREPQNRVAAWRILSVLTQRKFLLPEAMMIQDDFTGKNSAYAQHGPWLVTATNKGTVLQLWDTREEPALAPVSESTPTGLPDQCALRLVRMIPCSGGVVATGFRPDGAQLAAVTAKGEVTVFQIPDGMLAAGPHVVAARIERVVLSPDGKHIFAHHLGTGSDGWRRAKVLVVDAATGGLVRAAPAHWAAFSPDGKWLVTVSDSVATIREAQSWQSVATLEHAARVNSAEFSPDGSHLVTAAADNTACLWRVPDGTRLGPALRHNIQVLAAVFSPDGKRVLTHTLSSRGRLWDTRTGAALTDLFPLSKGIEATSFSADGRFLVTHYKDELHLRDALSGRPLAEAVDANHTIVRATFVGAGPHVLAGSFDGRAQFWRVPRRGAHEIQLAHRGEVNHVAFNSDESLLATAATRESAAIWKTANGEKLASLVHESQVRHVAFSSDDRQLVSASHDGTARIWRLPQGTPAEVTLQHAKPIRYADFSPNGQWLVTASEDRTARLWSATDLAPVGAVMRHKDVVKWAAFSPDSKRIVTVAGRSARLWSVPEVVEIGAPFLHSSWVDYAVFSPDGRYLATCGQERTARLWPLDKDLSAVRTLQHEGHVRMVQFDAKSLRLVTASDDGTARVWDVVTGAIIGRPMRHHDVVVSAEFSPDGRFVLTASSDQTARIWDADTGHPVSDPLRHDGIVTVARWSPSGRFVATGSYDHTARIWQVDFLIDSGPPDWLPALAEGVGGKRLRRDDIAESVPPDAFIRLKQELLGNAKPSPWQAWLDAFFAASAAR